MNLDEAKRLRDELVRNYTDRPDLPLPRCVLALLNDLIARDLVDAADATQPDDWQRMYHAAMSKIYVVIGVLKRWANEDDNTMRRDLPDVLTRLCEPLRCDAADDKDRERLVMAAGEAAVAALKGQWDKACVGIDYQRLIDARSNTCHAVLAHDENMKQGGGGTKSAGTDCGLSDMPGSPGERDRAEVKDDRQASGPSAAASSFEDGFEVRVASLIARQRVKNNGMIGAVAARFFAEELIRAEDALQSTARSMQASLAAKDAEIARLTRERDGYEALSTGWNRDFISARSQLAAVTADRDGLKARLDEWQSTIDAAIAYEKADADREKPIQWPLREAIVAESFRTARNIARRSAEQAKEAKSNG